tara:strand:+ start:1814 stop:3058 length:1245 start_codon:yes stop_codon:yes gene_type:complete
MKINPFKGIRPLPEKVKNIASRPYDVLSSEEAREEFQKNPESFLQVVKPEITLPIATDHYEPRVYQAAKDNFEKLLKEGVFIQDQKDSYYIYELVMNGRSQNGIVGCASVQDYFDNKIKKHELTRPVKEKDRKNHVRVAMMNAEPVFFAYKAVKSLDNMVGQIKQQPPVYDFKADDGVIHRFWQVDDPALVSQIEKEFEKMPATYVADGHHRTAAAALVGKDLQKENKGHNGKEPYNYFLAVHFPDNQLQIIDYNRVVKDLDGLSSDAFIEKLKASFEVVEKGSQIHKPTRLHEMSMYLEGNWYQLLAKPHTYDDADPIKALDVTILSESILKPVLNIVDLRTDERIDFVGGIRGLEELEKRVDSGAMKVAFALYPVSIQQLIDIADSGAIMPPKTTWFEPKLRSGLVVYKLED